MKSSSSLIRKVKLYIDRYNMISEGDTLIVGVSGGADSICLLHILKAIGDTRDYRINVVHINHGIRQEGNLDATFVENVCKDMDVPFFLYEKNVIDIASISGQSIEEAGREVRYEAYNDVIDRVGSSEAKIVLGHNKGDVAETVIFNMCRGTGLRGLKGISPVRDNIIRPLLGTSREEIAEYLQEEGVIWIEDTTNSENEYTRNKIRNVIIPYLENNINSNVVNHIANVAESIEATNEYIIKVAQKAITRCVVSKSDTVISIDITEFKKEDTIIQSSIIRELINELTHTMKDITRVHIMDIMRLSDKSTGASINLPHNLIAYRDYNLLNIEIIHGDLSIHNKSQQPINEYKTLVMNGITHYNGKDIRANIEMIDGADYEPILRDIMYTKCLDYGKISNHLEVRFRRKGDYIIINDTMNKKSIKSYMIDAKIPRGMRDSICLVADGNHILWVIGYRISEYYKVTKNTKYVLRLKCVNVRCGEDGEE